MQLAVYRSHDKLFPSISLSIFSFLESWGGIHIRTPNKQGVNRFFDFRFSGSTETARAHVTFIDFLVTKCTVGTAVYTAVLIFILVLVTHVHTTAVLTYNACKHCTAVLNLVLVDLQLINLVHL
jgi:hypothetical protein